MPVMQGHGKSMKRAHLPEDLSGGCNMAPAPLPENAVTGGWSKACDHSCLPAESRRCTVLGAEGSRDRPEPCRPDGSFGAGAASVSMRCRFE